MAEFVERYGTQEQCHAALAASRWPNGFVCPDCGCSRHCTFMREGAAISDGLWCFQTVTSIGATHEHTVTGGGSASVKLAQFRAVNTLLGNLKTAFAGTYHPFDFANYAHRYPAEVQYRFNRRFNLSVILARLIDASAVTKPHPERRLRAAEPGGQSGPRMMCPRRPSITPDLQHRHAHCV